MTADVIMAGNFCYHPDGVRTLVKITEELTLGNGFVSLEVEERVVVYVDFNPKVDFCQFEPGVNFPLWKPSNISTGNRYRRENLIFKSHEELIHIEGDNIVVEFAQWGFRKDFIDAVDEMQRLPLYKLTCFNPLTRKWDYSRIITRNREELRQIVDGFFQKYPMLPKSYALSQYAGLSVADGRVWKPLPADKVREILNIY